MNFVAYRRYVRLKRFFVESAEKSIFLGTMWTVSVGVLRERVLLDARLNRGCGDAVDWEPTCVLYPFSCFLVFERVGLGANTKRLWHKCSSLSVNTSGWRFEFL